MSASESRKLGRMSVVFIFIFGLVFLIYWNSSYSARNAGVYDRSDNIQVASGVVSKVATELVRLNITSTALLIQKSFKKFKSPNTSDEFGNRDKYLTIVCNNGRLGNQISSYAVLYGLAKMNRRKAAIQSCHADKLAKIFDIQLPIVNLSAGEVLKSHKIGWYFKRRDARIPLDADILSGNRYPDSFTFFDFARTEIRAQFTFKRHLIDFAESVLRKARRSNGTVFVGVHVRRGDYLSQLRQMNRRTASLDYFRIAFNYFRESLSPGLATFVVTSDDIAWCRKYLADGDVVFQDRTVAAEYDLALLAHCNHSIITYGTFGYWSAYLAGGKTLYLANNTAPGSWYDNERPESTTYLPDWKGICEIQPDYWKHFKIYPKSFKFQF